MSLPIGWVLPCDVGLALLGCDVCSVVAVVLFVTVVIEELMVAVDSSCTMTAVVLSSNGLAVGLMIAVVLFMTACVELKPKLDVPAPVEVSWVHDVAMSIEQTNRITLK